MFKPISELRGIRNNNPGNIRWDGKTQWQGMVGADDDGFIMFSSVEYGFRAMTRVLNSYRRRGVTTLGEIIHTWAPPEDNNDTAAYIRSASQQTGIEPNQRVRDADYPALLAAITRHENGINPYQMRIIERGIAIA